MDISVVIALFGYLYLLFCYDIAIRSNYHSDILSMLMFPLELLEDKIGDRSFGSIVMAILWILTPIVFVFNFLLIIILLIACGIFDKENDECWDCP